MSQSSTQAKQETGDAERPLPWALLLAVIALVLWNRCHEFFVLPTLRVEDGAKVYAHFYNQREWSELLRFKGGYIPLLPNVLGFIAARVPPRIAPWVLTVVPALQALLAYAVFFFPTFRRFVPSDRMRWFVCIALAAQPVGQYHLLCHTDFSIWNTMWLLLLLSAVPLPSAKAGAIGLSLGMQAMIWTHPLSFAALPLSVWQLVKDRQRFRGALYLSLILSHVAHVLWGIDRSDSHVQYDLSGGLLARLWSHLTEQVLYRSAFGGRDLAWALDRHSWFVPAFAALVVCVSAVVLVGSRRSGHGITWAAYALAAWLVLVPLLLVVLSKTERAIAGGPERYHYLSCLGATLWYALVLLGAWSWLVRWRGWTLPIWLERSAPGVVLVVWVLLLNPGNLRAYENPVPGNGERVRACFDSIAREQEHHGGPCGFSLRCNKENDWPIVINAPPCPR